MHQLFASYALLPAVYAIMMCGHTTPEVEAKWGDYGDMAEVLLKDPSKSERWVKYNVCDDHFPSEHEWSGFQVDIHPFLYPVNFQGLQGTM